MDSRPKTTEPGETAAPPRRPERAQGPSTRSTTIVVTAISLGAAGVITGGLAAQMAAGHDPALGVKQGEATQAGQDREPAVAAQTPPDATTGTARPAPAPVVTRTS
jgi:hypothetical protein